MNDERAGPGMPPADTGLSAGTTSDAGTGGHGAAAAGERAAPGADRALPSLPVRLAQLFLSPGDLFTALARQPVWVGALLAVVACGVVVSALIPEAILQQLVAAQAPPEATPEQIEGMLGFARGMMIGTSVLAVPIMTALTAGILLLIFNFLLGGEASFRQLFAATAHALFIWGVGQLVSLGVMMLAGDAEATLTLHLLAPFAESGTYLHRFLRAVELFGLWTAVVLGVALSRIYPRRGAGSAAAVVVALYLFMQATGAAIAGLFTP